MRLTNMLAVLLTDDNDQINELLNRVWQQDYTDAEILKEARHNLVLGLSESDYSVPFGKITAASVLVIIAKQEVRVKLNGTGNAAIRIIPTLASSISSPISNIQKADQPGMLFLAKTNLTSVHLTNPSAAATAECLVLLLGDDA